MEVSSVVSTGFPLSLRRKLIIFPNGNGSSSSKYASSSIGIGIGIGGGGGFPNHNHNNHHLHLHSSSSSSSSSKKEEEEEEEESEGWSSWKLVWRVEASLEAGEAVYISGDIPALGSWNPQSALPLFPTINSQWETNLLVLPRNATPPHFTYTYFIKSSSSNHADAILPRTTRTLLLPSTIHNNNNNILLVKDSWCFQPHSPLWGSWLPSPPPDLHHLHPFQEEPWLHHSLLHPLLSHPTSHQHHSVSTVILVNSSVCTMQRIAILEDENLVELLLEPVKNNVHCDSVYLGTVTKLVPNMGGAFVNIGISRPSLMDIKHNRDPFVFPPFRPIQHNNNKWDSVRKATKVIVQVVKEGLGTKGPTLTPYPNLRSRFWILITRCDRIGVSKKVLGVERTRLRLIAKTLQPPGFGLTVRTVAAGHSIQELQKDLQGLLSTWKTIVDHAKSAALAADEGVEGAVPVILHRAMGQTLSVAQDYFNQKVKGMIVDSPRTYHEITSYLQEIAPDLCERVELYDKKSPIFDEYGIEEEINNMLSKRVPLANGGSLVIEQTEALVSIDVNGGHGMLGDQGKSQEKAILEVNLAAANQIAKELRLRDIGGIIIVDFIDMVDDSNKRLVYEEVKKAVERDRSTVRVSELSRHGLMEITRKRVRPSVTFMISEACSCCHGTGRVEALETCFSKIEHEICRLLSTMPEEDMSGGPKSWPKLVLRVDRYMCNYLTSGKRTRLALLTSSLRVWILLKVARGFSRGAFDLKPFHHPDDTKTSFWSPTTLTLFSSSTHSK